MFRGYLTPAAAAVAPHQLTWLITDQSPITLSHAAVSFSFVPVDRHYHGLAVSMSVLSSEMLYA